MSEVWEQVDEYLAERLVDDDDALIGSVHRAEREGLPPIQVSPPAGRLLELLVRATRARRILEIGTLGGYSTIRLARGAGDGGAVISLEIDAHHAEVARGSIDAAGVADRVEVVVGRALETMDAMIANGVEPFDLFFIDADKSSIPDYVERAVTLSKPGSVIIVDNVVRNGAIIDATSDSPEVVGTRRMYDLLHDHPRLASTAIQTVGVKGYDGFALCVVTS